MALTKLFERDGSVRMRTHPIGRVSTLLACLLAALGFAFSSEADGTSGASGPTPIEFEGSESEPISGDSLEESQATQSVRRLRPRDFERAARDLDRPIGIAPCAGPSPCAVSHPATRASAGRDLLICQQRFLI